METKVKGAFWNIWTSYATYYFGKVNLGIIVPALLATYKNLSLYNVGLVSSGFFFAYALGQFIHGQIAERKNPFKYIALGLIASGVMNFFLGIAGSFFALLLLGETIDGFFQAMGWSSCVRANALIQKESNREWSSTLLGCSYQVGNSIAWLISAFAVGQWGWRAGFFVAGGFLLLRGILLLLMKPSIDIPEPNPVKTQIKKTLSPTIVLNGVALGLVNMVRYGVITWIPLYLYQTNNYTVDQMGKVGFKIFLIPIFGVLGTLTYNILKTKKDNIAVVSLMILAITMVIYPMTSGLISLGILFLGSFFLYGAHVFLVSTFPTRFKKEKVVAASTGFIDGMGYVGTISIGIIVPFLINLAGGKWEYVFPFWALISVLAAITVGIANKIQSNERLL